METKYFYQSLFFLLFNYVIDKILKKKKKNYVIDKKFYNYFYIWGDKLWLA